jgi:hypothetical protein
LKFDPERSVWVAHFQDPLLVTGKDEEAFDTRFTDPDEWKEAMREVKKNFKDHHVAIEATEEEKKRSPYLGF